MAGYLCSCSSLLPFYGRPNPFVPSIAPNPFFPYWTSHLFPASASGQSGSTDRSCNHTVHKRLSLRSHLLLSSNLQPLFIPTQHLTSPTPQSSFEVCANPLINTSVPNPGPCCCRPGYPQPLRSTCFCPLECWNQRCLPQTQLSHTFKNIHNKGEKSQVALP